MGGSQEREQKPGGPGRRRAPDSPQQQPGNAAGTRSAGAALERTVSGGLARATSPAVIRSLARTLGNRALSRLA
ncbi:MAG: hypothetical protein GX557_12790, partial [Chloroflexi bacterium]|nr:hypothetical protein [Chloroflexota bacterium]